MSIFGLIGGFIAANGGPVAVGVIAAQVIARAIPDDKKGVLGGVRTVAKVIGMYANTDEKKLAAQVEKNTEGVAQAIQVGRSAKNLIDRTKSGA
jgi:hypothetical protein